MKKGVLGVTMKFYAVLAFVLLLFNQTLLCGLLLGLVLVVEKDEWAARQCMQAFFMSFVMVIASAISGTFAGVGVFSLAQGGVIATIVSVIGSLIGLVVVIFAIIGLVRVVRGQEANLPVLKKWAYRAFDLFPPQPVYPQNQGYAQGYPPQGQPYAYGGQQPGQQPYPGQPPMPPQYPAQPPIQPQQPPVMGQEQPQPYAPPAPTGQPVPPVQPQPEQQPPAPPAL